MKGIMKYLMLSCQKAAELVTKKLNGNITPVERVKLKLHNGMCQVCKQFEDQQTIIDKALKKHIEEGSSTKLDDQTKNKIKQAIEKE